jgi:hypothetical protein
VELLLALPAAPGTGAAHSGHGDSGGDSDPAPARPCLEVLRATRRRRGGGGADVAPRIPALSTLLAADGFPVAALLLARSSSGLAAAGGAQRAEDSADAAAAVTAGPRLGGAYLPLAHRALAVAPADPVAHRPWPGTTDRNPTTSRGLGGTALVTALAAHPTRPFALVAFDDGTAAVLRA